MRMEGFLNAFSFTWIYISSIFINNKSFFSAYYNLSDGLAIEKVSLNSFYKVNFTYRSYKI